MTGIPAAGSGVQSMGMGGGVPSQGNARLKALENKLAQLKDEKQKAVKNKNQDKVKELEKEIQKVEQQIKQLKMKEQKKEQAKKEDEEQQEPGQRAPLEDGTGDLIDVYG